MLALAPAITLAIAPSALASLATEASPHAPQHLRSHAHGKSGPPARAAAQLHAHDTAQLHYVGAVGEQVYERGGAHGTLPGSMRVHMVFAARFTGSFTIYTRGGSITGDGTAKPHGGGMVESFAGRLVVSGGTGRYRHAHGVAALHGTFNRHSYALRITTSGTLHF